jgi:pimeloyl-ACP methyl ester carboxylesterase
VVALIETIGSPVHLVGHDLGAAVGWPLATRHPELLRSFTAVSVPHPNAFLRAVGTSRQVLKSWYVAAFQVPVLPEKVASAGGFEAALRRSGMTDDEVARFRREMVDEGALTHALMWYRAIPFSGRRHLSGKVQVPTTFVWSDGDIAVTEVGGLHTSKYVDAPYRYVELTGVTHWVPTQAPEALAEAILDRVASART